MVTVPTRLPGWLVERLDRVAEAASHEAAREADRRDVGNPERVTRSAVVRSLLADGLAEMEAILGLPPGKEGAW